MAPVRDQVAMALHLCREFTTTEAVLTACRYFRLTDAETAEVLEIHQGRTATAAALTARTSDAHPGRECSRDCAEYGCASWTAIDPDHVRATA